MGRELRRPSPALVVAVLALVVAVGGGQVADAASSKKQITAVVKKLAPGLSVLHATTSDRATNAKSADSAKSADNAKTADTARNALKLDGKPPSSYRVSCPDQTLPAGDLCYDRADRGPAGYFTALQTCARAGMRIPNAGELALVYDHLGAPQRSHWTAGFIRSSDGKATLGAWISEDSSRTLTANYYVVEILLLYRCVSSPTDAG